MPNESSLDAPLDTLSSLGRKLLKLDCPQTYQKLVVDDSNAGDRAAEAILSGITARDLLDGLVRDADAAGCMMAGLWLRHDWLDHAHVICQAIDTPEGALWHAIVHRREGDFSNSGYWYRKAGDLPLLKAIGGRAAAEIAQQPADKKLFRLIAHGWNPEAFVELVEASCQSPATPLHQLCVIIQELEWRLLFEHCSRGASGH